MSKGKDGAKKFYKSFTTAFPDAKFEITKALAIGDYAIVESTLKATHKGALGTIQPTKKPIAIHLVDIFKIKDGKVARAWTYQNSLEMQQQLGLFNVAAAATPPASQATPKPAGAAPATRPRPRPPRSPRRVEAPAPAPEVVEAAAPAVAKTPVVVVERHRRRRWQRRQEVAARWLVRK